ncbi:hypothetical protein AB1Y20_003013 [Prymnesium parvum]|uniref:RNA helicase n=1 Tax=Prymnesium parvum TaxID=97485 RepID=A0AB34JAZ3_PRYPA
MVRSRTPSGAEWLTTQLCAAHHDGSLTSTPLPDPTPSPIDTYADAASFYATMRQFVYAEAFTKVREAVAAASTHTTPSRARTTGALELRLQRVLRAEEHGSRRLAALRFSRPALAAPRHGSGSAPSRLALRAGSVFLLAPRASRSTLLAVIDGRQADDSADADGALQFEVLDAALDGAGEGALRTWPPMWWEARGVESVLLEQRCIDCCLRRPAPPFLRAGDAAPPLPLPLPPLPPPPPLLRLAVPPAASARPDGALRPWEASLDASQREAVWRLASDEAAGGGVQLLHGPPGTGKTTVLVALLVALAERRAEGRVLVCAPSNRAVQEVLERFVEALGERRRGEAREGGEGEEEGGGGRRAHASEDDVCYVGDGEKVEEAGVCSRVFACRLPAAWGAQLRRLAAAARRRPAAAAHCSPADVACVVRTAHTRRCAAALRRAAAALEQTRGAVARLGGAARARLRLSFGARLEASFRGAAEELRLAAEAVRAQRRVWPCGGGAACEAARRRAAAAVEEVARVVAEVGAAADVQARGGGGGGGGEGGKGRGGGGGRKGGGKEEGKAAAQAEMLSSARFVFCTLCVAGSYLVRTMAPVDRLVVDEAAQATEAEALLPLSCAPRRLLLAGDPQQLSCLVCSSAARRGGFDRPLMERLVEVGEAPLCFLETQYRMHPAIASFPSARFYQGRLRNGACTTAAGREARWVAQHGPTWLGPWALVDVKSGEERRDSLGSICNDAEAAAVALTVLRLRDEWGVPVDRHSSLRVLTFYAAQVRCIRKALRARGVDDAAVSTVDGSQGSEADVVILSLVRANRRAAAGFLLDFRRLNVALTRARQALVMFGHVATLACGGRGDPLADLVRAAADAKAIFDEAAVHAELGAASPCESARAMSFGPRPGDAWFRPSAKRPSSPRVPQRRVVRKLSGRQATLSECKANDGDAAEQDDAGSPSREARVCVPGRSSTSLAARLAELEAIEEESRRANAQREERRRCETREKLAHFAPPTIYAALDSDETVLSSRAEW